MTDTARSTTARAVAQPYVERALDERELALQRPTGHPYIVTNPLVKAGQPVIVGTRTPVGMIVHRFLQGQRPEKIAEGLKHLTVQQIYAALYYYSEHKAEILLPPPAKPQPIVHLRPSMEQLDVWGVADAEPVEERCQICLRDIQRRIFLFIRYRDVGFFNVNRGMVDGRPRHIWICGRGMVVTCERGHVSRLNADGSVLCE